MNLAGHGLLCVTLLREASSGEHFLTLLPFAWHMFPTPTPPLFLSSLACLYLIPLTGLSEILFADIMGRSHLPNSWKTQSFENKKREFGSVIAVEQNEVWHRENTVGTWKGSVQVVNMDLYLNFKKGLITTSTLLVALLKRTSVCLLTRKRRGVIHICYVFQLLWTWEWIAFLNAIYFVVRLHKFYRKHSK